MPYYYDKSTSKKAQEIDLTYVGLVTSVYTRTAETQCGQQNYTPTATVTTFLKAMKSFTVGLDGTILLGVGS